MNTLIVIATALLATCAAYPHEEIILKGPSGIITPHGPIGPTGPANGHDDGSYHGIGAGHHSDVVHAPGVLVVAPAAAAHYGGGHEGGWGGHQGGFEGGYGGGHEAAHAPSHGFVLDGQVSVGHKGVSVKGPPTVPAVVAGPAGKVSAEGLYGLSHYVH